MLRSALEVENIDYSYGQHHKQLSKKPELPDLTQDPLHFQAARTCKISMENDLLKPKMMAIFSLLKPLFPEEFETQYYLIIIGFIVLAVLYLNDQFNTEGSLGQSFGVNSYGYSSFDGPSIWTRRFRSAGGSQQSPINLQDQSAMCVCHETVPALTFSSDFHSLPCEMKMLNNGHSVVIYTTWPNQKKPTIVGGPLTEDYHFVNITLRWGPNDYEGSEHMVNSSKCAMELQAAFVKSASASDDLLEAARQGSLLYLSYLFVVTPRDNPYMEPIITSLRYIKCPMGCICIEPIILSLLMPEFCRDYFTYVGSLTYPPCTEGVRWIVKPEPLMISSRQVKKFRKLSGNNGTIDTNIRPVQNVNGRETIYYD